MQLSGINDTVEETDSSRVSPDWDSQHNGSDDGQNTWCPPRRAESPSQGVAAGASGAAMEVRLVGADRRFWKLIRLGVWPQPGPGRAWDRIQMPNKSPDKTRGGLGLIAR